MREMLLVAHLTLSVNIGFFQVCYGVAAVAKKAYHSSDETQSQVITEWVTIMKGLTKKFKTLKVQNCWHGKIITNKVYEQNI